MSELLFKDEVYQVVGAAMEVFNCLGCGFLEPVYQEALEYEFLTRGIPSRSQVELPIVYKDHHMQKKYVVDFLVDEKIILEIKAISKVSGSGEAQLINYLKASGLQVGLLINFGGPSLQWYRRVLTSNSLPTKKIRVIRETPALAGGARVRG